MPDDVEPSQAELLRVEASHEGAGVIVIVDGELDYSTTERFVACILEALDTKPRSITVDLPGVTFSDSSGLAALLRARRRRTRRTTPPEIRLKMGGCPALRRLHVSTGNSACSLYSRQGPLLIEPVASWRPYPGSSGRLSTRSSNARGNKYHVVRCNGGRGSTRSLCKRLRPVALVRRVTRGEPGTPAMARGAPPRHECAVGRGLLSRRGRHDRLTGCSRCATVSRRTRGVSRSGGPYVGRGTPPQRRAVRRNPAGRRRSRHHRGGRVQHDRVDVFWAHVSEEVEARPVSITVDARGLTFVGSSGLMALARARDAATEAGVTFRLSEPSPPLRRIAELCGLEDLLSVE